MNTHTKLQSLTRREREILDLIYEGQCTKEIARTLDCAPRTVEVHRVSIGQKMGTTNLVLLVRELADYYHQLPVAKAA